MVIVRRAAAALAAALLGACAAHPGDAGQILAVRAWRLHDLALVVDTHTDTTPKLQTDWDFSARHDDGHVDLPRLREGGLDAVFFSIWMGETPGDGKAIKTAIDRIDALYEAARRWPRELVVATTVDEIHAAVATGRLAALIGLEGGHIIEDDLGALRMFFRLGARYMTLTHSFHTNWADSAGTGVPPVPVHGGLTDFGRGVVREMNRLGMMVDISHVSDATFWDVLEVTVAPVIASHSSCRALADHPRNLDDDMLRALADNGGVVQINFYPGYIDAAKAAVSRRLVPQVTELKQRFGDDEDGYYAAVDELYAAHDPGLTSWTVIVDHIEHVIGLVGPDHVGLGADWDGVPSLPDGMADCSQLGLLTLELLRRGHSESTVRKVLGGNLLRVMRAVEDVAADLGLATGG